ncbi:MAG: hypothetical protein OEL83_04035 [Desulforhopalus sp.]|nr:hypothetical protein [Desulforhopalus sp.]
MKKIIASAVGLMLVGGIATTASAALENQFGGYWRTRFTFEDNFSGRDTASTQYVDTRTHLYYTAKFSDDFKFVNKFEFNTGWGDTTGTQTVDVDGTSYKVSSSGLGAGGDLGADGKGNWRIKNSYADFNVGSALNAKVGIQGAVLARGFLLDDDFAGVTLTGKFGNVTVPVVWMNLDNTEGYGYDIATASSIDQNILAALAVVQINDKISVTPYFVFHNIKDDAAADDSKNWYLGADADLKFGDVAVWATGIYNGGDVAGVDNVAFLGAVGADAGIVHGQFFYASGDDGSDASENNTFVQAPGRSYYWSEIMGYGVFDNNSSNGAPADGISNVWAGNAGVTIKPMDKLKIDADVWYASLAEDNAAGDTELGWEFDGKLSYNLYDNLTAEAVFAYLVSGDATGEEDVMEGGLCLSLKF